MFGSASRYSGPNSRLGSSRGSDARTADPVATQTSRDPPTSPTCRIPADPGARSVLIASVCPPPAAGPACARSAPRFACAGGDAWPSAACSVVRTVPPHRQHLLLESAQLPVPKRRAVQHDDRPPSPGNPGPPAKHADIAHLRDLVRPERLPRLIRPVLVLRRHQRSHVALFRLTQH